jgi:hypothetical protein
VQALGASAPHGVGPLRSGEKVTRNKQGEPVVRKYEEEAKVLVITIAGKKFCESTEDIEYLLDHFDVPNPTTSPHASPRRSSASDSSSMRSPPRVAPTAT